MRSGREDVPDGGLPGVMLTDVTVNRCPSCGAWEVEIPHHTELTKCDRVTGRRGPTFCASDETSHR
jgi:hypothetical protein